jgi:hypothetical protein
MQPSGKNRETLTTIGTASDRDKREITLIVLGITALIAALAGISNGAIANHVTTKKLTKVVEDTSAQVGLAVKDMQRSLSSLACMVMDHHLDLSFGQTSRGMCHCQYLLLHIYKQFRHCRGTCRLHSPTG